MEATKRVITDVSSSEEGSKPYEIINSRRTKEQIVAMCGPVGSGIKEIVKRIEECFKTYGYEVRIEKASDLIIEAVNYLVESKVLADTQFKCSAWNSEAERITSLQDMGDWLREKYGSDIVSQLFIKKVSANRQTEITEEEANGGVLHKESRPLVWILDSLKHPEEVRLLRVVYDKMFSLFGVLCSFEVKKQILVDHFDITSEQATGLIRRDESEDISHGQKLIKTLQYGDFFVRNSPYESRRVVDTIGRYVKIILGDHSITPTHGEYAMYLALSAAYRSGCMSRQVGAAIMNNHGEIVSTGFNDVPQFGGGLYTENSESDARCYKITGGECRNDKTKEKIRKKIKELVSERNPGIIIDNSLISIIASSSRPTSPESRNCWV